MFEKSNAEALISFKDWMDETEGFMTERASVASLLQRIKEYHQKGTYYEMTDDGIHIYGNTKVTIHGKGEVNVVAPVVSVNGGVVKLNS